jgi:glutamyl/glutaminyl-tRNA synthetase
LKANDQRTIIEQLLGITMLSERADRIKEHNRQTKEGIQQEEFRIRAVQEANKRIEEQIEACDADKPYGLTKHEEEIAKLTTALEELKKIDIEAEIAAHKAHKVWDQKRKDLNDLAGQISRTKLDKDRENKSIEKLGKEIATLEITHVTLAGRLSTTISTNRSWKVNRLIWTEREKRAKNIHSSYQNLRLPTRPWAR